MLVRIPQWLSEETRQFFEAIANTYDMSALSYRRLRELAKQLSEEDKLDLARHERIELFEAGWGFLNHAHILRELLRRMPGRKPEPIKRFVDENSNITELRNAFQHFKNNVRNQATKKGRKEPILGLLTWAHIRHMEDSVLIRSFVHSSGRFRSQETLMQVAQPFAEDMEYPIGLFKLQAFKSTVNISSVYRQMHSVQEAFDRDIKPAMMEKIEHYAAETGTDPEKWKKPCGGEFAAYMDFEAEDREGIIKGYLRG